MTLETLPPHLLRSIIRKLNNVDIVNLVLSSKKISESVGENDLFFEIVVDLNNKWFESIENYLKHKNSIKKVVIYGLKKGENVHDFFPVLKEGVTIKIN